MRKSVLFLLLATTGAMPALAQRGDDERQERREARAERAESRAERPQRADRPERAVRFERQQRDSAPRIQVDRQVQIERQGQGDGDRAERMQRYQQRMQERQQRVEGSRDERLQRYQQDNIESAQRRDERIEQWRQRRIDSGNPGGVLVERERRVRPVPVIQPQVGQVGPVRTDVRRIGPDGRYVSRDGHRYDRDRRHRWNDSWRHDRRYDWRRHRDRHRSIFRIGFYFDPFGYSYRRFGIGSYLYPNYYQSNYWINDPWQYRLPPAYGPYRWVRYHNDAVLIDTWTGEVVDVIYGFFW